MNPTLRAASLLPLALLLTGACAVKPTDASARRMLEDKACPPPGFDALSDFDLASFISAPWYVQKQVSRRGLQAASTRKLCLRRVAIWRATAPPASLNCGE